MAGEDPAYLRWIRSLPCSMCASRSAVEAHHKTGAGMGLRAHDHDAMPLCLLCHVPGLHKLAGPFKGWSRERLRDWQQGQIARCRAAWAGLDSLSRAELETCEEVF